MIRIDHNFALASWLEFSEMGVQGIWHDVYFVTHEGKEFQHSAERWKMNVATARMRRPSYESPTIAAHMVMSEETYVFFKLRFL